MASRSPVSSCNRARSSRQSCGVIPAAGSVLSSAPELGNGGGLVGEDGCILRQPHDVEGLLDGGGQAAETELALDLDHLLDHLDEDRDADRVDDLGTAEIEQEHLVALV